MENCSANIKELYLAGGCFWGLEAFFKRLPGIIKTKVGYANGSTNNPTYDEVCHEKTGHAETVYVLYDANTISTQLVLEAFFRVVDPTSLNRQGNDFGVQYRSGIYYSNEDDVNTINKAIKNEQKKHKSEIVTEVLQLENFYDAEEYHQNYLEKRPSGYCHINVFSADTFAEENNIK